MGEIYVYEHNADDFTTMGLAGALVPFKCEFTEVAGGDSSIELTHPLDHQNRWATLIKGRVLKCPVPVRTTPEIIDGEIVTSVEIWTVKATATKAQRGVFSKKSGGKRKKTLKGGVSVTVVQKPATGDRYKIKSGKVNGWIAKAALDYDTTRTLADDPAAIELAAPSWTVREQLFRIYSVKKTLNEVSVTARHISYDLLGNATKYENDAAVSAQTALSGIMANLVNTSDFEAFTDVADERTGVSWLYVNPITAMLDPDEGLLTRWGLELVRDDYEMYFLSRAGMNRGVRIEYAKNLESVTCEVNDEDVITRIIPVGKTKSGNELYLTDDGSCDWVDSPHINDFPVPHIKKLECSDCQIGKGINKQLARARMTAQAQEEFGAGCDEAKLTLKVNFVNLGDTVECQQYKRLEDLFLYDTAAVYVQKAGMELSGKVNRVKWDVLLERYEEIELGDVIGDMNTVKFGRWQIPIDEPINGSILENIYKLTEAETPTPTLNIGGVDYGSTAIQQDDYVPDGWGASMGSVCAETPYLWACTRVCNAGRWSAFSAPAIIGHYGRNGANRASVYLYKRSLAAATVDWTGTITYTFATGALSSTPAGWSAAIPGSDGTPCWMTQALATGDGDTAQLSPTDFSTPVKLVEDGEASEGSKNCYLSPATIGFVADHSGACPSSSQTIYAYGYNGSAAVAPTITGASGAPSGMTVTIGAASGTATPITVTVSSGATLGGAGYRSGRVALTVTAPIATTLYIVWGKVCNGSDGANATTYYTWVKYANDAAGGGMSDDPEGKKYIGLAYNKTTPTESTTASDYSWALFRGSDGVNGTPGANGETYYTWIKYSSYSNGYAMTDNPDGKIYIGMAYNKTTPTESTNPADYQWARFRGADGINGSDGQDGRDGRDGSQTFNQSTPPTANAVGDLWIDTSNGGSIKRWSGSQWTTILLKADNILSDTITANWIDTTDLYVQNIMDSAVSNYFKARVGYVSDTFGTGYGLSWYYNNNLKGGVLCDATRMWLYSNTKLQFSGNGGFMWIGQHETSLTSYGLVCDLNIYPRTGKIYDLGGDGNNRLWRKCYAQNHPTSSDVRLKRDIAPLNASWLLSKVKPVRYKYIESEENNGKTRFGVCANGGAGSVQDAIRGTDIETCNLLDDENSERLKLNYIEFVAVLIEGWQKHEARIAALEADNKAIRARLYDIERRVMGSSDDGK